MSRANHLWGAPHIHGELLKLGFTIAQSTVARYMYQGWPPSQGWRTFLTNHVDGIAAIDLFVLPTITFRLLYCLVILRYGRRLWVSFGVTTNRPGRGFRDRSPRRSRGTVHLVILFGTGTLRMVRSSGSGCVPWAFGTSRLLPNRRGRAHTSRG